MAILLLTPLRVKAESASAFMNPSVTACDLQWEDMVLSVQQATDKKKKKRETKDPKTLMFRIPVKTA